MSVYEFTKRKGKQPHESLWNNRTVFSIEHKWEELFNLVDKIKISQVRGVKKYKTLVISTEADFKSFTQKFVKNGKVNWNVIVEKYGGLVIDLDLAKSKEKSTPWIGFEKDWDPSWFGYIWRFKLRP